MSGYLDDLQPQTISVIDQRFALENKSLDQLIAAAKTKVASDGDVPEATFVRLYAAMPPEAPGQDIRMCLAAAIARLVHNGTTDSQTGEA